MASNATAVLDYDYINYSDWVEIHNSGTTEVNLSGFYLSDNPDELNKWSIPNNTIIKANDYLVIWTDGNNSENHSNFKLKIAGEAVILSDQSLNIIDSITFNLQYTDVSYGRISLDNTKWAFFGIPTPGKQNSLNYTLSISSIAPPPVFSISGGLYSGNQTLTLSNDDQTISIRYTTNSSPPSMASPIYNAPIEINSNTVVRAKAFKDGHLPSKTITNTYLINEDIKLPVVSITMDSMDLWDDHIGIYTTGTNGKTKYGVTANYFNNWQRSANIELYENNETSDGFNTQCGLAIAGERRNMLQKSLKIYMKKNYGNSELEYKLFDEKNINTFTSFFIRNTGFTDFRYTLIRDALVHSIVGGGVMDIDRQSHKHVIVFLNGEYWGLYNIRERVNADYLATNHGIDPNDVDILEFRDQVIEGDNLAWNSLINYLETSDMTASASYDYINKNVDLNEWYNYLITEIFFVNCDWPDNNNKRWKAKNSDGKWRWILIDTDAGLNNWAPHDTNMIFAATDVNSKTWAPWSTLLIRKFLENPTIQNEFLQRYAAYTNTIFKSERILHFIDSLKTNIEPEMPRHIRKWGENCEKNDSDSKDGCVVGSMDDWYTNIDKLIDFANNRSKFAINHLIDKFDLSGTAKINLNFNKNHCGKVYINDIPITDSSTSVSFFKDIPLRIQVIPNPGFWFAKTSSPFHGSDSLSITLKSDITINLNFTQNTQTILKDTIKENTTLTKEFSPYLINSTLVIDSFATLTINPGVEILLNNKCDIITYGNIHSKGNFENIVIISPNSYSKVNHWGSMFLLNSTDTSIFEYTNILNGSSSQFATQTKATLSSYKSNIVINNCRISGINQPVYIEFGNFNCSNSYFECPATCDMINVKYGTSEITNCQFKGNKSVDTDAIDYDQIKNGIIKNCFIYDFEGGNSDGIDLGEQCDSILVEGNFINNCTDKGISIGQGSSALLYNNIIVNCTMGIGIKDSFSYAYVSDNTLHNIDTGIACFEKNLGAGGGGANVINTIFSNCNSLATYVDNFSFLNTSYSLSNHGFLVGNNNIYNDPFFKSPLQMNFSLRSNSPCIGKGDPTSYFNQHKSSVDIGADPITYIIDSIFTTKPDKQIILPERVTLHPNPIRSIGIFQIPINESNDVNIEISIYNGRGQKIKSINQLGHGQSLVSIPINLSNFSSGVYFYKLRAGHLTHINKFIKSN